MGRGTREREYRYTDGIGVAVKGDDFDVWKLFDGEPSEEFPDRHKVRLYGKMDGLPLRIDLSIDGIRSVAMVYTIRRCRRKLWEMRRKVEERLEEIAAAAESGR